MVSAVLRLVVKVSATYVKFLEDKTVNPYVVVVLSAAAAAAVFVVVVVVVIVIIGVFYAAALHRFLFY